MKALAEQITDVDGADADDLVRHERLRDQPLVRRRLARDRDVGGVTENALDHQYEGRVMRVE